MENTTDQHKPQKDNTVLFYVIGGVIVTAVIIAGFLLYRPSQPAGSTPVLGQEAPTVAPVATSVPKAIGSLSCAQQYYNTVNGVAGTYYLSTDGEAPTGVTSVTCNMTATVNNEVVASETVTPGLLAAPERNGSTFRCVTKGLSLKSNVPTKMTTEIKDSAGNTVSCTRAFLLP